MTRKIWGIWSPAVNRRPDPTAETTMNRESVTLEQAMTPAMRSSGVRYWMAA